jgi:hypothetical protein
MIRTCISSTSGFLKAYPGEEAHRASKIKDKIMRRWIFLKGNLGFIKIYEEL